MPENPLPCDRYCPFVACDGCPYKGGANPAVDKGSPSGARCDFRAPKWDNQGASNEAAPAGNRGLTTPTSKES